MKQLDLFKKNRLAVELLLDDAIQFLSRKFNQSLTNFSVASAYGQIVFVLANITQLILLFIERSVVELNINTATRATSVYGLSTLVGHNPTRAIGASGMLALSVKKTADLDINGGQIVIPNQAKLKCKNNGMTYVLDLLGDEIRFPLDGSKNGSTVSIVQGSWESQSLTGTDRPLQSITVNYAQAYQIDHHRVHVFVNGRRWKRYDAFYDIPREAEGYILRTAVTGQGLDVFFGNTNFGKQPPLGAEIRVEYLITNGSLGNLQLADGEDGVFTWTDPGFTIYGEDADLEDNIAMTPVVSPDFGSDPEPIELTRLLAPKQSRSFVLANPDAYIAYFEKFNKFSIIDAFQTEDENLADDKVIYVLLVPDVKRIMKSNENYFTVDENRFLLTRAQKLTILELIERSGSKVVSTEVQFVDPVLSRYVINVALIIYDDVAPDLVKQEVINRLSDYFLAARRRDRIPRSDLIYILEGIDGVDSVNISIVSETDERSKRDGTKVAQRVDTFGDIVIVGDELPVIRGGWTDSRGIAYETGIEDSKPSSVNIVVTKTIRRGHNTAVTARVKTNIRK